MFPSFLKEKYLLWSVQILSGAIFFLPILTLKTYFFPFITPRNFVFRILVEVLVFLYILLVLKNPLEYLPRKNIVWILFAAFIASLTLSSILAGDFAYSLWSNYERMDGLLGYYHLFAYFFILYCVIRRKAVWERLLEVSVFAAILIIMIGVSQAVDVNLLLESSGGDRITSTLGNPTYLAAYLLIHLFIALYFLARKTYPGDFSIYPYAFLALDAELIFLQLKFAFSSPSDGIIALIFSNPALWAPLGIFHILAYLQFFKKFRTGFFYNLIHWAMYLVFISLALFLIVKTRTRGAIAGLIIAVVLAGVFLIFKKKVHMFVRALAFAVIVFVIGGVFWVLKNPENSIVQSNPLLQKIASVSQNDRTTETRILTWKASVKGFFERPNFGWGVENFYRVFDKYFPPEIYEEEVSVVWYDRPHNSIIQYAIEGGAIGLILYLGFIGTVVYFLFRYLKDGWVGAVFLLLIAAYLAQNFFVFDSFNSSMPFYFLAAFMLFLIEEKIPKEKFAFLSDKKFTGVLQNQSTPIIFVSAAILIGIIYIVNISEMAEMRKFTRDILAVDYSPSLENIEKFMKTAEGSPYLGRFEKAGYLAEKIASWTNRSALPDNELLPLVRKTEKILRGTLKDHPNDVRLYLLALTFFLNTARLDESHLDKIIELREITLSLSPTRSQSYQIIARALMGKQRYKEGLKDFQKAVDLAPEVLEPRWNLFAAHITLDEPGKAREQFDILKKFRLFTPEYYIRGAKIYTLKKYYIQAISLLLEAIDNDTKNASLYAQLADLYAQSGDKKNARESALKTIEIDPTYEAEGKEFLRRLETGEL